MSFAGKTAIVTGGTGGLGAAITKAYLDADANVVAVDVNAETIKSFQEANSAASDKLLVHQADITSEEAADGVFAEAIKKFGQVDMLVNNAGIMDKFDPVGDLDIKLWRRVLEVNLTGPFIMTKRAVNHMVEKEIKGSIVNIESIAAGAGWSGGTAYTCSKSGLHGLTRSTAAFYREKGIRCNAIMPGPMQTQIAAHLQHGYHEGGMALQQKKMATMGPMSPLNEVAGVVLFLSHESNSTVTGAAVPVDSGWGMI